MRTFELNRTAKNTQLSILGWWTRCGKCSEGTPGERKSSQKNPRRKRESIQTNCRTSRVSIFIIITSGGVVMWFTVIVPINRQTNILFWDNLKYRR